MTVTPRPDSASSFDHCSRQLRSLLDDQSVTELCLQRPGEIFIERRSGWTRVCAPWATGEWARHFARLVATATEQRVDPKRHCCRRRSPVASGAGGVAACDMARPRCHRNPSPQQRSSSSAELASQGVFGWCRAVDPRSEPIAATLTGSYRAGDWRAFLAEAVRSRLNVLVAGATGSGKTTLTKALIDEIPAHERLVSIEDAAELAFRHHLNSVRLFYSKDDQGLARVTPKQLLEASLRLRPDRILLAELRGEEAYYFLRNVSSGHPGSIPASTRAAPRWRSIAGAAGEGPPAGHDDLADIHRLLRAADERQRALRQDAGPTASSEL